jgi:hypothetical protein
MKGSTYSREVLKDQSIHANEKVLKDSDFRKLEGKFYLEEHISKMLIRQMILDSRFFLSHKIIDYSIIVFIVEENIKGNNREEESLK